MKRGAVRKLRVPVRAAQDILGVRKLRDHRLPGILGTRH